MYSIQKQKTKKAAIQNSKRRWCGYLKWDIMHNKNKNNGIYCYE